MSEHNLRQKHRRLVRELAELAGRLETRPFPETAQAKRALTVTLRSLRSRAADLDRLLHPEMAPKV